MRAVAIARRPFCWREGRGITPPPHAPGETWQRTAVASGAGVPPGRACRRPARTGVSRGGRGLLRRHGFACGPVAAVLRMRALSCGPAAARLRAGGARERASGTALSQPAPSPPACRGSHVLRATPRVTPAHRLHALRSRVGGAGAHALVWRVGWWGRPCPHPARRPGTAAGSRPTPRRMRVPSPRPATRPQRGRPAGRQGRRPRYPALSPYHLRRYSSRVTSPAATSSMSWRFSATVSCTMESS